ncbi:MAG TPA: thiamine pyrophosphate-binding protein [Syntrophobacteraceae bacterium]|nr:thiamine pyrophosphate-binding protein [Syntrophobacteraceae bacterium]
MGNVSGGQLVAKALKQEGVEAVFTLCGGHVMDIYNGCLDENIRIIDVRHEQTAAHAADAWTRLTGVPGVAVVTAGPGVTDAVTGVANAFRAQVPMLLIGGQAPVRKLLKGGLQEMNHVDILKPVTKFSCTVLSTERIPEIIGTAFREAFSGRPGPVFLEIPQDVLDGEVDEREVHIPVRTRSQGRMTGDPKLMERAVELLSRAQRPVVLAGTQVWTCRGAAQLLAFVEKARVPTYLNGAARGCLPPDSPRLFSRSRRYALSRADVVLILGTPLDFRLGYGGSIGPDARIIQVDLDYSELCRNRAVEVPIQADSSAVLEELAQRVSASAESEHWPTELRGREADLEAQDRGSLHSDAVPIHPLRLAREIDEFLGDESVVIVDGGDVVTMSASVIRARKPGHWLDPGPLGTLGVGTPFAVAAKTAMPDKEVVVLFGDGAFGLTGFDYDTLVRFNLPVIGIVANNAAWNQVRFAQLNKYGPERGNTANLLSPLRYDRIVEAMGGHGEHVTDPSGIRPALERARESGKPACINVMVDREVFSSSTRNLTIYK